MFLGLSVAAWITIAVLLAVFLILLLTKLPADFVFFGAMATLFLTGVLKIDEAFGGIASSTVLTVGVLFIVIAGLVYTGVLGWITEHVMGTPKSYPRAITRLMLTVAGLSSILSNTTVVALFTSVVKNWSRKLGITPSKLLIPLSYAAGMGGICTIIGTPPNLIISEQLFEDTGTQLGFFSTTLPGLFCLCIGILSTIAMRKLLPERRSPDEAFRTEADYTLEMIVPADSDLIGKTVADAGLMSVQGGRLIRIIRFDRFTETDALENEFIMGNDHLIFSGNVEALIKLRDSLHFVNADRNVFRYDEADPSGLQVLTASVKYRSKLIGKTISDSHLEEEAGCCVIAIARGEQAITESPREVVLQAGDMLLVQVRKSTDMDKLNELLFISGDNPELTKTGGKSIISAIILIAMIVLSTLKVMPLLSCCFLAAAAMLICHCCSFEQARKEISWSILIIFAGSIAFGEAIDKTGLDNVVADAIQGLVGSNALLALIILCFVGTFFTEFVSNTAAAAILYPIAYSIAESLGANPITFCIALMIAVSSSFATPIGSPTHMLVYGPGGYRFSDFARIGLPMNLIILTADIFITVLLFPL